MKWNWSKNCGVSPDACLRSRDWCSVDDLCASFIGREFGDGRPSSHQLNGLDSPSSRFDMGPSPSAVGGLSVTGCLADFSVYIFHPYGGGKKSGKLLLPHEC